MVIRDISDQGQWGMTKELVLVHNLYGPQDTLSSQLGAEDLTHHRGCALVDGLLGRTLTCSPFSLVPWLY